MEDFNERQYRQPAKRLDSACILGTEDAREKTGASEEDQKGKDRVPEHAEQKGLGVRKARRNAIDARSEEVGVGRRKEGGNRDEADIDQSIGRAVDAGGVESSRPSPKRGSVEVVVDCL